MNKTHSLTPSELFDACPALFSNIRVNRRRSNLPGQRPYSDAIAPDVVIHAASISPMANGPAGFGFLIQNGERSENMSDYIRASDRSSVAFRLLEHAFFNAAFRRGSLYILTPASHVTEALVNGSVSQWKASGWRNEQGEQVENFDRWENLLNWMGDRGEDGVRIFHTKDGPQIEKCRRLAWHAVKTRGVYLGRRFRQKDPNRKLHSRLTRYTKGISAM